MKHLVLILAGLLLAGRLLAQVEVRVTLPQEQFLPGESIEAAVRISNLSSAKIAFGTTPDWLRFNVESTDEYIVNRIADTPESGEFSLEPSTRGTVRFDIQPLFELSRPGRYRLTATVRVSPTEEVVSSPVFFEVFRGTRLWERAFSTPSAVAGQEPIRRKYLLQQATHLRDVRLYVRVTDEAELATLKVIGLGRTVSFGRPACAVDRQSHLHTLHQTGADTYSYHLISPHGVLLVRRTYEFDARRPQLRVNEAGEVAVIGGSIRRSADDVPSAPKEEAPSAPRDEPTGSNNTTPKAS